ncbi:MAG: aminotransferase class IV [Planctomycetaceae bacterium]|nr:aminotransferase class IV [Planctomycetaceae bacterium]
MNQPAVAFLNGRWIPAAQATVSVADAGFVLGATVSEQLRTCGGKLFLLDEHLDRLERSLAIVGVSPGMSRKELVATAQELVHRNHPAVDPHDDLGLSLFVTPGPYPTFALDLPPGPTVGMHTYPLPFHLWHEQYATGTTLATVDIEPVPNACWPANMKCRSRMHYYLADRAARAKQPGARAVLVDQLGRVYDTSTATVIAYFAHEGLVVPPAERVLAGISAAYLKRLAELLGIGWTERDLTVNELIAADEVLLTSTPFCLLAVTRIDDQPVSGGHPGPVFQRLLEQWNQHVGLDIVAQSRSFAQRGV